MRFVVEHINKVREADILLNGLTVIAGENDSGKSTVGRLLFSTIKALANTRVWEGMDRRDLLEKHVSSLYKRLFTGPYRRKDKEINSLFPLSRMVPELLALDPSQLNDFLQKRIEAIEGMEDVTPRNKMLMLRDIDNIRICLMESENRAAGLTAEIQYFIESEFMNKICSFQTESSRVELYIDNHEEVNLSYTIAKDKVGKVEVIWGESLQDATYIESPLYVHLMDSLLYATSLREIDYRFMRPMVPSHIKDLMEKIDSMKFVNKRKADDVVVGYLEGIMDGRFEFDGKTRNLFFSRDKVHFSPINVASGIKTFGLIQMLIETGVISENKVLIWDEPENHLHPQWQVEFAHVLVNLAKAGIPVLISTHSPYFIQGIRYFSAMEDVEQFVNYYLTEEKEGLTELMEVSNDLNRVFLKLAEPLNNIMNVDDVRVSKKSK